MAGITFIHQQNKIDPVFSKKALTDIQCIPEASVISKEETYILVKSGRPQYPVKAFEFDEYTFVIEGKIYGIAIGEDAFFNTQLKNLFNKSQKAEALMYLRALDGEFIIYAFDNTTKKLIVVNDFLGRLPAYYVRGNQFILSRDLSLLKKLTGELAFDEQGVYEFMRLGFPIGDKTLYKNLYRLPPSTCIEIAENITLESKPFSLNEWAGEKNTPGDHVELLYGLFKEAVRNRLTAAKHPALSISGGLDSRIIMGEIEKEKLQVAYESFIYKNPIIEADAAVVKLLTEHFGRKVSMRSLNEWSPGYFDEMINIKLGMNYLGMAFLIPFLIQMAEKYDMMLTGDGGDKTLAYLFPAQNLLISDPAKIILLNNEMSSSATCRRIFGCNTSALEKKMIEQLRSFGYKDNRWNYKHFLIFERMKNWLFEGEDRNRNYIWSTSPFYHPQFFKKIHSLDENEKKDFRFYKLFIKKIHPELNGIINANWGFPINDNRKLRVLLMKQAVKTRVRKFYPDCKQKKPLPLEFTAEANQLLAQQHSKQLELNSKINLNNLSKEELFHLLTLLKVSEKITIYQE